LATGIHWNDKQTDDGTPDPVASNTGYSIFSMVPGLGLEWKSWRMVTNLGIPLYQSVNGDQLVPGFVFQSQVSYGF
jgi:hypothetical protein